MKGTSYWRRGTGGRRAIGAVIAVPLTAVGDGATITITASRTAQQPSALSGQAPGPSAAAMLLLTAGRPTHIFITATRGTYTISLPPGAFTACGLRRGL